MKLLPLAAFNTLCILGSSLNYLQNNHFVNTDTVDNPEHKFSSLLRSQSCQQSFFGASRSSRNSRKRLEIKRNQVFDPFWGVTRGTNFFVGISGCIFCCPKIFLLSHHLPLPKSWICQKIYNWYVLLNKLFSLKNAIIMHQNSSKASGINRRDFPGLRPSLGTFSHLLALSW